MKRLAAVLLFAIFAVLLSAPAHAATPSPVSGQTFPNTCFTTTASLSCSFPSAVTAHDAIFVYVGGSSTAQGVTIATPTMTGETFTQLAGASNGGTGSNGQIAAFYVCNANGGQKQVSVSESGTPNGLYMVGVEVTGQANGSSSACIDASGNTQSTTLSVSTSAATTTATDLVFAGFMNWNSNYTFSPGTGYTTLQQINDSTDGDSMYAEYTTTSSTGTQTATATHTGTAVTVEQGIVAIAGAAASGVVEDDSWLGAPGPQQSASTITVWGLIFGFMLAGAVLAYPSWIRGESRARSHPTQLLSRGAVHCTGIVERIVPIASPESFDRARIELYKELVVYPQSPKSVSQTTE